MIRTRFAPSPTGFLHVGGLRTALYNYLFAKQNNGQFVLRIEDTDQRRKVAGAVENLIATLDWAGVKPDEGPNIGGEFGPYVQSERLDLYRKHALELLEKGHAYYCFCSAERLQQLKERQTAQKIPPRYDNHCRSLSAAEVQRRLAAGEEHVIRLKVPPEGTVMVTDLIRGQVTFPVSQIDDQVLIKSDGFPTYHLANVIDDHFMQISHVIRGEEWLPSTPKHVLLYQYFGWELPQFAHLSLLLNPDKSKLSKRQGDIAAEDYRKKGFLPEALINFLALLGWNPGDDREIFSMDELIREFSLERVGRSGAIFNVEKLQWMNGLYIRNLQPQELLKAARPYLPVTDIWSEEKTLAALNTVKDGLNTLADLTAKTAFYFAKSLSYDSPDIQEFLAAPAAVAVLTALIPLVQGVADFDGDNFVALIKNVQKATGVKGKPLWMAVRAALTGESHGPEIQHITNVLDRKTCLSRLTAALEYAQSKVGQN